MLQSTAETLQRLSLDAVFMQYSAAWHHSSNQSRKLIFLQRKFNNQGLPDLDQSHPFVKAKLVEFFNRVIDMGVAGFRVDASKHMWPVDLAEMFKGLHNLSEKYFAANTKPYLYQEVIDLGGEAIRK